ncbi:carbamoyltransferase C-terminal domain-containing protein [Polynucleobacter sp. MWH-HuK1]|uniref:carbamoyltransferase family protein n=1 Tax=Polynucleobacter sp. MWH-HuK1 TaxID=1743158 RepID=UPI001C0DD746|nr:carbamoyltransferase C-terminal domain-containing protein [Polynucleobacter sp. MWH-HuK1]MBU3564457.1 carbamoyltransferase [Polynucleobacter sp. MWH-HuK1]
MTYILGINAYHGDSSACLVKDGVLIAAAEEERFRRIKHWAGFPSESIRYCLAEAGIELTAVDNVAINQDPKANLWRKILFTLTNRPDIKFVIDRLRNKRERLNVRQELSKAFPGQHFAGEIHGVEHHESHLASAFLVSPFDEAVVVSVDGFGDFASAAWGLGRGAEIREDNKVYFPHSLGIFYQALTQFLGFPNYGDEYKVMGLAPYGSPKYLPEMRNIVRLREDGSFHLNLDYFQHHKNKIKYEWENGEPRVGGLFTDALCELLGPARRKGDELTQHHKDIARSIQAMYEEAFFHLLKKLYAKHGVDNLALAGGCAMNSVANGKIYRNTPFKKVYIQSAAGDAGGAIGAAFNIWHKQGGNRRFVMDHAYWGPSFKTEEVRGLLEANNERILAQNCRWEFVNEEKVMCNRVAKAISDGKVIGWFYGRMEWGPRALGNRSILGDPRRADMKDILNLKIKRRESFRPFAPSILRKAVPDWFETDDEVPFMMQVYQIREDKRSLIPAVTHVDGSGRLQTVSVETNPRYAMLIESFGELTGVPLVLNTSFNENEPVVCRPEEALDCFLRTKMDVLVLGDYLVTRNQ